MKNRAFLFKFLFCLCIVQQVLAQPIVQPIKIIISPNHADWKYNLGDTSVFEVSVLKNNVPIKNITINYSIGLEKMKPAVEQQSILPSGKISINGGVLKEPGFLRCTVSAVVDGKQYKDIATAGYAVENIQPTVQKPQDFESFWNTTKIELNRIPLDAKMLLLPERCSALTNVYQVNIQNYGNSRLYGILSLPKKPGKYPAILQVPGAGIRPYGADLELADKGFILLAIGIHGIPVIMDTSVYANLTVGALKNYQYYNPDNRDRYYYKRVYMGCLRANDFLTSLPQFDGINLAVTGGSQGGALSIVTAALDKRVKYLAAFYPALSDMTGYLNGRAGGWPHFFNESNLPYYNNANVIKSLSYYDVVNFAKDLTVEGYYSFGYNDETCPPTSMYAAYNSITAPKSILIAQETGHWTFPEQRAKVSQWLQQKLKSSN